MVCRGTKGQHVLLAFEKYFCFVETKLKKLIDKKNLSIS